MTANPRYCVVPAPGGRWELWDNVANVTVFGSARRTAEDACVVCERHNELYRKWMDER